MQFNSYDFIMLFLPVLLAGYFLLNRLDVRLGKLFLVGMGVWFYVWYGGSSAAVLLASMLVNYAAAALVARRPKAAKLIVTLDVAANIALLVYFKYFNFILSNLNALLHAGYHVDVFLPLGISFFTFQQISYVLYVRRKGENDSLLDYLLYILYFPKLIMGPITEPETLIPQFGDAARKRADWKNIACGLKLFGFGLFKKMILADTFAAAVNWCFSNIPAAGSADLFLCSLAYTFEIYFDFSGYSDMAVGVSQMLNIDLPINFDSPYKALSIRDFWKRWHMSLTGFLTRNVYIPLGGSRRGVFRTCLNTLVVFLVSGLWHGANWTFVLWGLLHGLLSVADRLFDRREQKLHAAVRWCFTFLCVNFLWLLFRADSVSQWLGMLNTLFHFRNMAVSPQLLHCFEIQEASVLLPVLHLGNVGGAMALLFYVGAFLLCLIPENCYRKKDSLTLSGTALAAAAFFFGFLHLGGESVFVYFNF